jgi:hypothetical protein
MQLYDRFDWRKETHTIDLWTSRPQPPHFRNLTSQTIRTRTSYMWKPKTATFEIWIMTGQNLGLLLKINKHDQRLHRSHDNHNTHSVIELTCNNSFQTVLCRTFGRWLCHARHVHTWSIKRRPKFWPVVNKAVSG